MSLIGDVPELPKRSLLNVVVEEHARGKELRTSRVLLIGHFASKADGRQITDFLENFVAGNQKQAKVTGLLLAVNEECFIHCLEAPTKTILILLREINAGALPGVSKATVCAFNEEVPREFNCWATRAVEAPQDDTEVKDFLKAVFDTLKQFLELGREIAAMPEQKAVDYLHTTQVRVVCGVV
jgi:hypothetical protein